MRANGPIHCNNLIGDIGENFAEKFILNFFTEGGKDKWVLITSKNGRTGIDNLFVKLDRNGNVRDVLIVEAKVNKSKLGNTLKGKQMSKEWILKSVEERLKKETNPKMRKILEQVREK